MSDEDPYGGGRTYQLFTYASGHAIVLADVLSVLCQAEIELVAAGREKCGGDAFGLGAGLGWHGGGREGRGMRGEAAVYVDAGTSLFRLLAADERRP